MWGVPTREEVGPIEGPTSLLALAHRCPERGSTGWQFRHEGVLVAVEGSVEGAWGRRVVGGEGEPRHVGPAPSVHRDVEALIATRAPKEGGVIEPGVDDERIARVV